MEDRDGQALVGLKRMYDVALAELRAMGDLEVYEMERLRAKLDEASIAYALSKLRERAAVRELSHA